MHRIFTYALVILAIISIILFIGTIYNNISLTSKSNIYKYDINQDGVINQVDYNVLYDVFLGCYITTPELLTRCDINNDGFVTDSDVFDIMNFVFTHDSYGNLHLKETS